MGNTRFIERRALGDESERRVEAFPRLLGVEHRNFCASFREVFQQSTNQRLAEAGATIGCEHRDALDLCDTWGQLSHPGGSDRRAGQTYQIVPGRIVFTIDLQRLRHTLLDEQPVAEGRLRAFRTEVDAERTNGSTETVLDWRHITLSA